MPVEATRPAVGPCPLSIHPLNGVNRVGFLKPIVKNAAIEVGEYTYYDDPSGPEDFEDKCVLYHYPHMGDRLVIGRFCAIAANVRFIMNGANHALDGLSTFPFSIFANGWENPDENWSRGSRGDTRVGNDVWIGMGATIMPGVTIGDGAIIGSLSVVARDVPAYGVVVGNPATVVKRRFDEETIARLLALAWWNWPAEKITQALPAICGGDIDVLEQIASAG